jgi:hypothetical protein
MDMTILQQFSEELRAIQDDITRRDVENARLVATIAERDAEIERLKSPTFTPDLANRALSFETIPYLGVTVQQKVTGRATRVTVGGRTAVRLHTEPGDNNVSNSGDMERNDLAFTQQLSNGFQGAEDWWHHEILFPDDFSMPTWHVYVVADFHNSAPGGGQANFMVLFKDGAFRLQGYGGIHRPTGAQDGGFQATLPKPVKNRWYEFDYHVKWSSGTDGFFDAWLDRKRVLSHKGPTLYAGQGVYFKLANYHTPVCDPYPACIGTHPASSVIHTAVRRGRTWQAVANGVLDVL